MSRALTWGAYGIDEFDFADFPAGSLVVDVGCGKGNQLTRLLANRCRTVGIDVAPAMLAHCRARGLTTVALAQAEAMPIPSASVDGIVLRGVMYFTDERRTIAEISRVLKPGGRAKTMFLGSGYFIRYMCRAPTVRSRSYGLRGLVGTAAYVASGRRLPSWWGSDRPVFQSRARLARYYAEYGLTLVQERASETFAGRPVFLYHTIERKGATPG